MQNSEALTKNESEALRIIRSAVLQRGGFPTVRELMTEMGYKSPRSAAVIIESLLTKEVIRRKPDGGLQLLYTTTTTSIVASANDSASATTSAGTDANGSEQTVDVPLLGAVACGMPILAEQNVDALIPVSVKLAKPGHRYFFLRAKGDSMNERGINNGDMALVKQQKTANNGDLVVALIDDEATLKEFHLQGDLVVLKPRSSNKAHQPILLTRDFQIQGVVITTIPA